MYVCSYIYLYKYIYIYIYIYICVCVWVGGWTDGGARALKGFQCVHPRLRDRLEDPGLMGG